VKSFRLLADSINATTAALFESLEEYGIDDDDKEDYEVFILQKNNELRLGLRAPAELAEAPEVMGPAGTYAGGQWYYSARFRLIYPTTEA
jgi:hypothetical protein